MVKVSLVIPYIIENDEQARIVDHVISTAATNQAERSTELVLINNGGTIEATFGTAVTHHHNEENIGVVATFQQGYELATGDVIAFIHSDVLLHERGWDTRISEAFDGDDQLGLAGLFGARTLHPDGIREHCMSNMLGAEWGSCDCHASAALHHGTLETGTKPAAVFDGVGLFFRRECLQQLVEETDMFAGWHAPHHFYDRIMSCKVADLGWHMAVIAIGFDHWSGATANSSVVYRRSGAEWLNRHGISATDSDPIDLLIYRAAEQQFFEEFQHRLPLTANPDYSYTWRA